MKVETFGEIIRRLRESHDMPLKELASILNIDQSTLSKIERNERKPNLATIAKLSSTFHIDKEILQLNLLSDIIASILLTEEDPKKVLVIAEKKIKHLKSKMIP